MGGLSDFTPGFLPKDVQKRILSLGKSGPLADAPKDTKISFHFRTTMTKEPEKIIDDSRNMKKPMELIFGKKFKLEIWEAMLKTMADKEVAEFNIPKKYLDGYAVLSKTLRDSETSSVNSHHCCGMLLHSCGYHDLDHLLTSPEDLTFIFEILSVDRPGEYVQDSWMLTMQEKADSIAGLKESGNHKFKAGKIDDAKADYFLALSRIEQLTLQEKPGTPEYEALQEKRAPLLLNYGLCLMKEGTYYEAIEHLSNAKEINPDNAKAYFRLAKCHQTLGNYKEALENFDRAAKLDPSLEQTVVQEIKIVTEDKKKQDKSDGQIFNKLFSKS